ncbi:MAG: lysyl-tRNA synthetase, class [Solirubrobacteraceae bacterium]|jgi:lysyl-tRNA synthetase class 2|nr:lysyl-tRNA synthetase [Solirubrobacterales bacterium]MEA2215629.1 lysyl-tRNA synthetase, class [Solirubrobacteraceae bacterium]
MSTSEQEHPIKGDEQEDSSKQAAAEAAEGGDGVVEFDERRAKMERLRAEGIDPYPAVSLWGRRTRVSEILAAHDPSELEPGAHPEMRYLIAGRLVSRRGHGKTAFLDLRDLSGSIQVVLRVDSLGQETYDRILGLDIGDIVSVEGCVYVTQRGQLALEAVECTLLTKTLRPPPDKHHGLGDTGTRYRYRELDLIANQETRELFITRNKIILSIREWLAERNFTEIETPALQSLAGGAGSRPFTTHHNALDRDLYLRISVELFLNRCIVGGMENVYDMGKVFRNEGISPKHSPEFTIIEFMCAYSDYNDVATVTEEMFRDVAQKALGRTVVKRNGEEIDLAKPWRRVTMRELIFERFGLDFMESTREQLAEVLDSPIDPSATWAEVVADIYSEKIESTINQPTHVFDFPLEPFPITKRHAVHPELGEHFDAVIGGIELVSGDTELNDPVDQWQRFVDQRKRRMIDDEDVPHPNDEEYARAIEYGYAPTAGGGMGVDRLVMILTERDTLREVIPFPIVRDLR